MATTGFDTNFYINYGGITTPGIIIVDTTDYAGQSIVKATCYGNLKVTAPSGVVIHDNTDFSPGGCDMPGAVYAGSSTIVTLPLLTNGTVQRGVYTIQYKVYNSVASEYYTVTKSIDFEYVRPVLQLDNVVDYDASLFTSTDSTNYVVNTVSPATQSYDHSLYYPAGSAGFGTPIVGSDLVILTSTFYPGTQTSTVRSQNTYIFDNTVNNVFTVYDTIAGFKDTVVSTNDVCSYYCCIKKLYDRMVEAKCKNHHSYSDLALLFSQVMGIVSLISTARICGHTNDISGYLDQIKELIGCSDDCDDC